MVSRTSKKVQRGAYGPCVVIWKTGTCAWMQLPSGKDCSLMGK